MTWKRENISLPGGGTADAVFPTVVSASRRTDIPAFHWDWFLNAAFRRRLCSVRNPWSGSETTVSFQDCRFFVFWSKRPDRLLDPEFRDLLNESPASFCLQYTLNDYPEKVEPRVGPLSERVRTYLKIAKACGPERVVWRFDPLLLTEETGVPELVRKVRGVAENLGGAVSKLVFSFADVAEYPRVARNLAAAGVRVKEWTASLEREFAERLSEEREKLGWKFPIVTCCEKVDLSEFGITHNSCVDPELIFKISRPKMSSAEFENFAASLGYLVERRSVPLFGEPEPVPKGWIDVGDGAYAVPGAGAKNAGQRLLCRCARSLDVGAYDTCGHGCAYCYANRTPESGAENALRDNPESERIVV